MREMSQITGTFFVGSERDSLSLRQLAENKITHIVRIGEKPLNLDRHPDIVYQLVEAYDSRCQNIQQHFSAVNEFVHRARLDGGVVLIHCMAGVSRSVAIAAAYLMTVTTLGRDDVLRVIKDARAKASPNLGFLQQLEMFEREGLAEERRRIRTIFSQGERDDPLGDDAHVKACLAVLDEEETSTSI